MRANRLDIAVNITLQYGAMLVFEKINVTNVIFEI